MRVPKDVCAELNGPPFSERRGALAGLHPLPAHGLTVDNALAYASRCLWLSGAALLFHGSSSKDYTTGMQLPADAHVFYVSTTSGPGS